MSIYPVLIQRTCDTLYDAYRVCQCDNILPSPYEFLNASAFENDLAFRYYQRKWSYIVIYGTNLMYFFDADTRRLYNDMDDDKQCNIRRYMRMLSQHKGDGCLIAMITARETFSRILASHERQRSRSHEH